MGAEFLGRLYVHQQPFVLQGSGIFCLHTKAKCLVTMVYHLYLYISKYIHCPSRGSCSNFYAKIPINYGDGNYCNHNEFKALTCTVNRPIKIK